MALHALRHTTFFVDYHCNTAKEPYTTDFPTKRAYNHRRLPNTMTHLTPFVAAPCTHFTR